MKTKQIKIMECFGGIGSATETLKRLGFNVEVVDYVEIDKFAVASYNAINGENFEPQDITKWDKNLNCDLIMHGSPCQDFSLAGLGKGGDENSGTRSSLLYESLRIIAKIKPKYIIWENVKGVLSAKHKPNFDKYIQKMSDLGYENYYQVLNSKDYEIPQNRERVFVVSILGGGAFNFPKKKPLKFTFRDFLQDNPEAKYFYMPNSPIYHHLKEAIKSDCIYQFCNRHKPKVREIKNQHCKTLEASMGTGGNLVPIFKQNDLFRKLTPLECWRLMGFSDDSFFKAAAVNSDTQLYKQAGNSIVVNVLMAIFEQLFLKANHRTTLF